MSNYGNPTDDRNDMEKDFAEFTCRDCRGTGIEWRTDDDPCPSCFGEGNYLVPLDELKPRR